MMPAMRRKLVFIQFLLYTIMSAVPFGAFAADDSVRNDCVADFHYYQDSVHELRFHFEDLSTGDIVTWFWDFGDGNSASGQNQEHSYQQAGTYYVCLEVSSGVKDCYDVYCDSIEVPQPNDCQADFTYSINLSTPFDVHFQSLSTGHYDSLIWLLGDGTASYEDAFTHTYPDTGYFLVQHIVWNTHNPYGCRDTVVDSVHVVFPECKADFMKIQPPGSIFTYQFENTSSGMLNSYLWNISDGTSYSSRNLTHIFPDTGLYYVQLRVKNIDYEDYCYDIERDSVYIEFPPCIADFSYAQNPENFYEFSFNNFSSDHSDRYIWSFGDGSGSVAFEPVHIYSDTGDFVVSLRVMSSHYPDYCDDIFIDTVSVSFPGCFPDFEYEIDPLNPFRFSFNNLSQGLPNSYIWSFGDGYFSSEFNAFHAYSDTGYFPVRLKILNTQYLDLCNESHYDTVYVQPPPFEAKFNFTYDIDYPGFVTFSNLSSDFADTYYWDFGDGASSTEENPVHFYEKDSVYQVCLTAFNSEYEWLCKDTYCDSVWLNEYGCDVNFSWQIDALRPFIFRFDAQTGFNIDQWEWDFGDGGFSTEKNPTHSYTQRGEYKVSLYACKSDFEEYCRDTIIYKVFVNLSECIADFIAEPDENYPSMVRFFISDFGSSNNFRWYFGDGNSSTAENPIHQYESPGNYTVSLVVRNTYFPELCSDSTHQELNLEFTKLNADFDFVHDTTPGLINTFYFSDQSEGQNINKWEWSFDDGFSSHKKNPVHQYPNQKEYYKVQLIVSDQIGPETSIRDSITKTIPARVFFDLGGSVFTGEHPINNPLNEGDTAFVELYRVLGEDYWVRVDTGYFHELGYYFFPILVDGSYSVRASLTPHSNNFGQFLPTNYQSSLQWAQAEIINLTNTSNFHADLHLIPLIEPPYGTGTINACAVYVGQDVPPPGIPAQDIPVYLLFNDHVVAWAKTDNLGLFSFTGLAYENYVLQTDLPGYLSERADVSLTEQRPIEDTVCMRLRKINHTTSQQKIDYDGFAFFVYPNPASDHLNASFVLKKAEGVQYCIYDAASRLIVQQSIFLNEGINNVSLLNYPLDPGMYLLQIRRENAPNLSAPIIFIK